MTPDDLDLVSRCAALAPSVHNTQPWRVTGERDRIEMRADVSRQLGYLDPDGRQLHMSCGAAIEFARLGVRGLGRECTVDLLPDRDDPALLAVLTVGPECPTTDAERAMLEAMPRRYTDRQPYGDQPVPADVLHDMRVAAESPHTWLRVIDRPEHRLALAAVLEDAEAAEAADPDYADELARWTGTDHHDEGLPPDAASPWPEGVVSDLPLRDFGGHARHPRPGPGLPPRVERDTLVLVGSDAEEPLAWLRVGLVLGRLLLQITVADLVSQPLGPATDFPATRARVRRELGLVGWPQFLLRLGYGQDRPHTGRRDVGGAASRP